MQLLLNFAWIWRHVLFVSVLKKVKHRLVENLSSGTADALGLSRAILCNGKLSLSITCVWIFTVWHDVWLVMNASLHRRTCEKAGRAGENSGALQRWMSSTPLKTFRSDTDFSWSEFLSNRSTLCASTLIFAPMFACRFDGAHKAAAQSFLWALADTQRWVCHAKNLTSLPQRCGSDQVINAFLLPWCLVHVIHWDDRPKFFWNFV